MISRGYVYGYAVAVTRWGLGDGGALGREGEGEIRGYSEIPRL
jgi:hypothetical protein